MTIPSAPTPAPDIPTGVAFVAYTDEGRIDGHGNMPQEMFYFCRNERGHNILMGHGRSETHYIEFVGEARAPVLRIRPQLAQGFDKTEIAVREAATLPDVPAATVSFEGPMKGTHRHPGGDLVVGWTLPGTYTVRIEAFPYLPAEFKLTVGDAT
ncbi:hypothetical protein [Methylorubrum thiocyanatum]